MGADVANQAEAELTVPQHVAFIMDGNGRWAQSQGLDRLEGHKAGAKTVRMIVEESRQLGVRYLTLYAFSSENWGRPEDEVSGLMALLGANLQDEFATLQKNGIRLRAIGDLQKLPETVRVMLNQVMSATKDNTGMDLILALSYGARDEIISACRKIAQNVASGEISIDHIDSDLFCSNLYTAGIPDPDLLIRTSNEFRISNFLLWQIAYSELVFTEIAWPALSKEDFFDCLREFSGRKRRFGLTDAQIKEQALN
jgi:undecaprenyl diphosphate synthase